MDNALSPGSNWKNYAMYTVPLNNMNHNFSNHQDFNQQSETNNYFANLRGLKIETEKIHKVSEGWYGHQWYALIYDIPIYLF